MIRTLSNSFSFSICYFDYGVEHPLLSLGCALFTMARSILILMSMSENE